MKTKIEDEVPFVSFIIATHDRIDLTKPFLKSFFATVPVGLEHEIIIIDDASSDETFSYLKSLDHNNLIIERNDTQQCYAKTNNKGVSVSTGQVLCFLNNDLILTSDWFEHPYSLLLNSESTGIVGNIQRNAKTGLIDHAGIAFDLNGIPFHRWKNRKRIPLGDFTICNAVTGACLFIRKADFEDCGGFDESYINGAEDVDFCVRMRIKKKHILVSHKSVIHHHISSSPGRMDHVERNMEIFLNRWSATTTEWGQEEWPREYLNRYARHFWKMKPSLFFKALLMISRQI